MTLKQLKQLKQVKVKRIFHGKYSSNDIDLMRQDIIQLLIDSNVPTDKLTENDGFFNYGTKSWFKPKLEREVEGIVTFRSKDYVFEHNGKKSYGTELKSENVNVDGFSITTFNGEKLEYKIIKE